MKRISKKEVAENYLKHLENGDLKHLLEMFNKDGMVDSPLYGIKKAKDFYRELKDDTSNSKLQLKGIFEESNSPNLAIYFTYEWTLKNGTEVKFDVVDILELDDDFKILQLKIIYDTVDSRALLKT